MYRDLRSKLEMYRKNQISIKSSQPVSGRDVQDVIKGTVCQNVDGQYFFIESRYPLTYIHGGVSLGKALEIKSSSLRRISSETKIEENITDFLFLDTETTGLSGGAGTVAFLIGTGCFEKDVFVLRQYFMRDYDEEAAVLRALNDLLSEYKGLITFNGKAFDWNLLQNRYIFNRIKPSLPNPLHIDLLFPSRRIWQLKLENCKLVSLEENVLGVHRCDDIPGSLIPSVYFKYIEDRDAEDMKRVVNHNKLDILSMVSLLTKIAFMVENPLYEAECQQELLGIGRIFEKSGEYHTVIKCFEECLKSEDTFVKETASKKLSDIYKRSKNYKKAVEHWYSMIRSSKTVNITPMIELAKYYEHRERNIPKAIEIVEKAIQCSSRVGVINNIYYDDLKKRLSRLMRKAGRSKNA